MVTMDGKIPGTALAVPMGSQCIVSIVLIVSS
jgi:hypothetical protein